MIGSGGIHIVQEAIEQLGEPVTLRRILAPGPQFAVVQTKARFDTLEASLAPGGVAQARGVCRISARDLARARWPIPPRRGDQVVTASGLATIQSVDELKIGGGLAGYRCIMDGAG